MFVAEAVCGGLGGVDRAVHVLFRPGPAVVWCALLTLNAGEMAPASPRAGFVPPRYVTPLACLVCKVGAGAQLLLPCPEQGGGRG